MLVGGADREFRHLIHRLLIISGRLEAVRELISQNLGVTGVQYSMMMSVLHQGGSEGMSIGALAKYHEVTGAHITTEIGKLASAGLVLKLTNPRDGRGILVRLTPEGQARLFRTYPLIRGINDRLFDSISGAEFKALRKFTETFVKNTEAALGWAKSRSPRRRAVRC
jgi:MarR family transcriptional regulator, organic hydroperoxide resistance regulator